ncbi:23S rRNA (uracil(1939)-C(5))-methyltransferase RlmD [Balamuthia mandrillaris]
MKAFHSSSLSALLSPSAPATREGAEAGTETRAPEELLPPTRPTELKRGRAFAFCRDDLSTALCHPITTEEEEATENGEGPPRPKERPTYRIFGALEGEEITFQPFRRKDGRLHEVIKASPLRGTPECPEYGRCGGCSLMHVDYPAQISLKTEKLWNILIEGGISVKEEDKEKILDPPIFDKQYNYRQRARLSVRYDTKRDTVKVGFHHKWLQGPVQVSGCRIMVPRLDGIADKLSALIHGMDQRGSIPTIELSVAEEGPALIVRHMNALSDDDKQRLLVFGEQNSFIMYTQSKGPETIQLLSDEPSHTQSNQRLTERFQRLDLNIRFEPIDFRQVNHAVNERMLERAIHYLELGPDDHVLDLFCGLGNFSLPVARRCASVVGVEGEANMVKRAKDNAIHNNISNTSFFASDLYKPSLVGFSPWWPSDKINKVIVDPPRSGASETLKLLFLKLGEPPKLPERFVYVSCNPSTMVVGGRFLQEYGYTLRKTCLVDMFPNTAHMESISLYQR